MTREVRRATVTLLGALLSMAMATAVAQDGSVPAPVQVMEHDTYGEYLTDEEGRTLYVFVDEEAAQQEPEQVTEGIRESAVTCTGPCLDAWPPFATEVTEADAPEAVASQLLYNVEVDGRNQAVYNGWPLYYFAEDLEPGAVEGQAVQGGDGVWYVVNPEGQLVTTSPDEVQAGEEADDEVAGGGAAQDDSGEDVDGANDEGVNGEGDAEDGASGDGASGDGANGGNANGADY